MADTKLGSAKNITIEGAKFLAISEKDLEKVNKYFEDMKKTAPKGHCCDWCCVKCA